MGKKQFYSTELQKWAVGKEKQLIKRIGTSREIKEKSQPGRCDFERDYARVLYASSFRRLQGKMQLLSVDAKSFNRNRLTHSLEVAQIGRSISKDLGLSKSVVTETASLAHDIGNPPFGHYGEKILNNIAGNIGGYEGNAQAFRILRLLEVKSTRYAGLNLTYRSLLGITKYFQKREGPKNVINKKYIYNEDYEFLKKYLEQNNCLLDKSIDAQVMDIADEIAYAAHDLEDALSFNIVTVDEIVHEFLINKEFRKSYEVVNAIVGKAREKAMKAKRLCTSEEYSVVLRKELTSMIVHKLMKDIQVTDTDELGYGQHKSLADGLKKLLFNAILRKKDVQLYEKRGERVIKGLFEVYNDDSYNKELKLLPSELRALHDRDNEEASRKRLVVDYISGMMDYSAIEEYVKYFGRGSLEKYYIY